jgi:hypothetical protein
MFNTKLSLYIPYVSHNTSNAKIGHLFESLDIGIVAYIHFIKKIDKNGILYKSAHIYFKYWMNTVTAIRFQEQLLTGSAKLVYDDPKHWIILRNKYQRVVQEETVVDEGTVVEETIIKEEKSDLREKMEILTQQNVQLYQKLDAFYELFEVLSKQSSKLIEQASILKTEKRKLEKSLSLNSLSSHTSGYCFN